MKQVEQNKRRWSINAKDLPIDEKLKYQQQCLPDNLGEGYSNFFKLGHDLNFIETDYFPTSDFSILSQFESADPRLVVTLGIKGASRFLGKKGEEVFFSEGYTTITSFNSSIGSRQYEANNNLVQLRFVVSEHFCKLYFGEQYLDRLFTGKNFQNLSFKPITSQGLVAAQQLLSSKVTGETQYLLMHGNALSLLASELTPLFASTEVEAGNFNANDREIAKTARDILFTEFRAPPSVCELSRRVGTNQFKLKKIFHYFFNATPYGLLLEIRMNKAYKLLEDSTCHVGVVADFVGYNHANNFSTAFSKFFGFSPKYVSQKNNRCLSNKF